MTISEMKNIIYTEIEKKLNETHEVKASEVEKELENQINKSDFQMGIFALIKEGKLQTRGKPRTDTRIPSKPYIVSSIIINSIN